MKFCPVVPEICRGQVHVPKKERRRIIIIIIRNGAKTISLQTLFGRLNKHLYISSNPNNISRYFPLIGDEIVDGEGLNYPGYIFSVFF